MTRVPRCRGPPGESGTERNRRGNETERDTTRRRRRPIPMATWCVYHLIHVTTPFRYLPKLVVTDVPAGVGLDTDLLERAGYQFGEFGIPWANHGLTRVDRKSPPDLIARLRQGEGERITYHELAARAEAAVT